MGKFKFIMGSGGVHNIVERLEEQVTERKRQSTLRREEKRKLREIEKLNRGKS